MKNILKNSWYAASWSENLFEGKLLPIKFLDKDIVFFRRKDGSPAAILDRCPHRFAPLSMGNLVGNSIECGYHGLCFDDKGECSSTPSGEKIASNNKIPYFATHEIHDVIWIWGGEPELADTNLIPCLPYLSNTPENKVIRGITLVNGDYQLGSDNLMDLTHPQFLHGQSFGDNKQNNAVITLTQEENHIIMEYFLPSDLTPPGFDTYFQTGDTIVDTWLTIRWQPASILTLEVRTSLVGQGKENGKYFLLTNLMSPVDDDNYRYLWGASRTEDLKSENVDKLLYGVLKMAFDNEDSPMIQACHERMRGKSLFEMKPVLLQADQGAVRVRRLLQDLINKEELSQ